MQQTNNRQQIALLVCFLVLIGGTLLNQWIWPPPPKPAQPAAQPQEVAENPPPKPDEPAKKKDQPPPAKPKNNVPRQFVRLGGDDSNIAVTLDSRGSGVRRVMLNKFQEADALGKPEYLEGDKKRPQPLEWLMEEKNKDNPSYLFYHFDPDKESDARPLATLGQINWQIVEPITIDPDKVYPKVVFQAEVAEVRISKTYTLDKDDYHIGLEVKLESLSKTNKPIPFRYQLTSGHGLRLEGEWYTTTFRNALICQQDDKHEAWREFQDLRYIAVRGGGDEVISNASENRHISYAGVALQYFASLVVLDDDQADHAIIKTARPTLENATVKGRIDKVSGSEFTLVLSDRTTRTFILDKDQPANEQIDRFSRGQEVGVVSITDPNDRDIALEVLPASQTNPLFQDDIAVRMNTKTIELKPGEPVVHKYLLYNGPVKVRLLGHLAGDKAVPDELLTRYLDKLRLDTLTDYHFQGQGFPAWIGEHISSPIGLTRVIISVTNLMHGILTVLHKILPGEANYGLCIILLTIMVRGIMFPLSRKMALTSLRMQELAPELKKLQEKHKEDPQARGRAQMDLYRKHNVSPLGSCWMVFLQMPIFLGLYYALQESIHFRLAPFLWIDNLAAPDMLIYWGNAIPFISRPESYGGFLYLGPYFNILPIIAVSFMIVQQKLTMPPPTDEQTAMQQKIMKYMMVFMGLMFYKVAAGLCLYFIASSVWGYTERKLLPKKKKDATGQAIQQKLSLLEKALARFQGDKRQVNGDAMPDEGPAASQPSDGDAVRGPAPAWPGLPSSASQARRSKRKAARNKLKANREPGYVLDTTPSEQPRPASAERMEDDGWLGGLRTRWRNSKRRLREWWDNVLEQARKK
ncbi:MAG: YidC/Oxa1 family insertase periplasmic-domain containing protein [Gemmataceae bacterium]